MIENEVIRCNCSSWKTVNAVKLLLLKNGKDSENVESALDAFSLVQSSENNNGNDLAAVHYWMGIILFDKEDYESALEESEYAISLTDDALFYDLKGCSPATFR